MLDSNARIPDDLTTSETLWNSEIGYWCTRFNVGPDELRVV